MFHVVEHYTINTYIMSRLHSRVHGLNRKLKLVSFVLVRLAHTAVLYHIMIKIAVNTYLRINIHVTGQRTSPMDKLFFSIQLNLICNFTW